ncbi:MAG TPA: metalloregulator ArsR/SmtB family transcription factor, partial [Spirochaetota bacterium]|nr:metalloregulator ArsR/SmtB family transcription factor [Spirochaetota bacterium]
MSVAEKYIKISEKLKALGNPTRFAILVGLLKDECNVTQIQQKLDLPQSTVSQHLNILKNINIIQGKRKGTQVCYQII